MDYFESIAKTLLEDEGYWVKQSFKVNLSIEQKSRIGKPSIPRPEIDLLALNFKDNELIVFEAKSYFDSSGTKASELSESHSQPSGRYKLFTCQNYQDIVLEQLSYDLKALGLINDQTSVRLGLILGKVLKKDALEIERLCQSRNWVFWSPEVIKAKVTKLADKGYENEPAVITAKILLR